MYPTEKNASAVQVGGEYKDGRKKVMFFTNSEYGQANVIFAVAYELLRLQRYEVHIASFSPLESRVTELNELMSAGSSIKAAFHNISGPSSIEALSAKNEYIGPFPPGIRGAVNTYKITLPAMVTCWEGSQYMAGYESCQSILTSEHPDLVVIDPLMCQGLEACQMLSRPCVVLSPNTFHELLPKQQPLLPRLIRSPAIASGFKYPVPLYLIFANIYLRLMIIYALITSPRVKYLVQYRKSQMLPKIPPVFDIYQKDNHYLVPSIPQTDYPCLIPSNVTPCGPILLPETSVAEYDPELEAWLSRGPTVMINLGSQVRVDDTMARGIALGMRILLNQNPYLQVLWKLKTSGGVGVSSKSKAGEAARPLTKESLEPLVSEIENGRVRVMEWLAVDPSAVLQTGHVVCSVHHGGSNSFHEALAAGIPQVILPCWLDTLDFANRVEWLGIGVYGSRNAAPSVEATEFSGALMKVLNGSEEALRMKAKAKELGEMSGKVGGRKKACEKIVELLDSGFSASIPLRT